jgi:CBS domain-containing protein
MSNERIEIMAKVRDAMKSDFAHVLPTARITEVAEKMADYETDVIPVCDNGKFRGVVRERDITSFIVATGDNPGRECALTLIDRNHPMVSPREDLFQAANIMAVNGVNMLPVTQDKRLLGVLSVDDIAVVSLAAAAAVLVKAAKGKLLRDR